VGKNNLNMKIINKLNSLPNLDEKLFNCCGSTSWVSKMIQSKPFLSKKDLFDKSEKNWESCDKKDFLEAFTHHPKIGDINSLKQKFANTLHWASNEQASVSNADMKTLELLQQKNIEYEQKYGYIFIVCATGKSAEEMLTILLSRLENDPNEEILVAANEQSKITTIRLNKLLNELTES